jgi:soluble lytic murein transglycosylase
MKWRSFLLQFTITIFLAFLSLASSATMVPLKAFEDAQNSSASDVKLARHIHTTMRDLRRGRLSTRNTKTIYSLSKKSEFFDELTPLFRLMHELATKQSNRHNFSDSCNKIKNLDTKNLSIAQDFSSSSLSFCRNLFLAHMVKAKKHKLFSDSQEEFIQSALHKYLHGEYRRQFHSFLQTIPRNTQAHKFISAEISKQALLDKIVPDQEVLSFIEINPELTSFIQHKGLMFSENARHFKNEFRSLANQLTSLIRTEQLEDAGALLSQTFEFYQSNSKYLSSSFAWHSFNLAGKRFIYQKNFKFSEIAFEYALSIAPDSEKDESYFYKLWPHIIQKKYSPAAEIIEQHQLISGIDKRSSKLRYWISKTLFHTGEQKKAKEIYSQIADSEPLSFYGILALKELSLDSPAQISHQIIGKMRAPSSGVNPENLLPTQSFRKKLGRLSTWLDLDLNNYSYSEINDILDSSPEMLFKSGHAQLDSASLPKFLLHQMSYYFNTKKKYLHSFRLIYNALNRTDVKINGHLISSLYPLHYLEKVKSTNKNVDPLVILSLMRQESAFNPRAKSVAGARGLMQLMPATARMMHGRLRNVRLYDADFNIKLGTKYFQRLEKKYNGNLIDTLCAYNAGEGNLKKWKDDIFVFGEDNPLEKIEMIPFSETRKYVKLIYRNLFYYRLLTNDPMVGESLAETLRVSVN